VCSKCKKNGCTCAFNELINCEKYVHIIVGQFLAELTEEERLNGWFQQDSATAKTARVSMQALSVVNRERIISSGMWQTLSTDLNPCDFCSGVIWKTKFTAVAP
jgi:hypothetical protein